MSPNRRNLRLAFKRQSRRQSRYEHQKPDWLEAQCDAREGVERRSAKDPDIQRRLLVWSDRDRFRKARDTARKERANGKIVERYQSPTHGVAIKDEYLTSSEESEDEPIMPWPLRYLEERILENVLDTPFPHTWDAFRAIHEEPVSTLFALPRDGREVVSYLVQIIISFPRIVHHLIGLPQLHFFRSLNARLQKIACDFVNRAEVAGKEVELGSGDRRLNGFLSVQLKEFGRVLNERHNKIFGGDLDLSNPGEIWMTLCQFLIHEIMNEKDLVDLKWTIQHLFGMVLFQRSLQCSVCEKEWTTKISRYGLDLELDPTPDQFRRSMDWRTQRLSIVNIIKHQYQSSDLIKCRNPACVQVPGQTDAVKSDDTIFVFPEMIPIYLRGWREHHRQQNPRSPEIQIPYLLDLSNMAHSTRRGVKIVFYRLTAILAGRKVPQAEQAAQAQQATQVVEPQQDTQHEETQADSENEESGQASGNQRATQIAPDEKYEWTCYTNIQRELPRQSAFIGDFHSAEGVTQHRQALHEGDFASFHELNQKTHPHILFYVRCNEDETPYQEAVVDPNQVHKDSPQRRTTAPWLKSQTQRQNANQAPDDPPTPKEDESFSEDDDVSNNPSEGDAEAVKVPRAALTQWDAHHYLNAELGWMDLPRDTAQEPVPRTKQFNDEHVLLRLRAPEQPVDATNTNADEEATTTGAGDANANTQATITNAAGQTTNVNAAGQTADTNAAGQTTNTNAAGQTTDANAAGQTTDANAAGQASENNQTAQQSAQQAPKARRKRKKGAEGPPRRSDRLAQKPKPDFRALHLGRATRSPPTRLRRNPRRSNVNYDEFAYSALLGRRAPQGTVGTAQAGPRAHSGLTNVKTGRVTKPKGKKKTKRTGRKR